MQTHALILGLAALPTVLMAGIHLSAVIHDRRIADLTGKQYMAMHQMRDKTFARVMPPLALATLGIIVGATALLLPPGLPLALGVAAAALVLLDIVVAVRLQVPINRWVQTWTATTIPADWAQARDRWAAHHATRTLLVVPGCLAFWTAVLLALGQRSG